MNIANHPKNKVELIAELDVEVDQVGFSMSVEGDAVIISVKNIPNTLSLIRKAILPLMKNERRRVAIQKILNKTNMTVYMHNRYFGIYGPKANPILRSLLLKFA